MLYLQYYIIGNDTFYHIYRKNKVHKCVITHTLAVSLKEQNNKRIDEK